jgi:hypothetical protein
VKHGPHHRRRWNRPTAFQLAIRLQRRYLEELHELFPPDEHAAVLDVIARMVEQERHRISRWRNGA